LTSLTLGANGSVVSNCRLVHSGKQPSISGTGDMLTFGTRSGTRHGVEAHVFCVQTSRDLAAWTHALVQGVSSAVLFVREVTTGKTLLLLEACTSCLAVDIPDLK